jgi:membrane fusion protein, multidrug efflux system
MQPVAVCSLQPTEEKFMSTAGNQWNLARKYAWVAMVCVLLCLAEQGCNSRPSPSDRPSKAGMRDAVIPVEAAKVVKQDVPVDIQAIGTVEASSAVTVKSQVSGELLKVYFREGDFVKKDDELFKIDSRTYEAQLTQQQANLARDEATLTQLEANLARDIAQQKYAQSEAARYASLFEKHLVSKEQMEQSAAGAEAASATVRADQAALQSARSTIEATRASIANARVLLGYASIRSPLDGRTGTVNLKEGNIISPNTDLTTINHIDPVYVAFSVPQSQLPSVKKGQTVTVSLQDSTSPPQNGSLFFIDNAVDASTGTILIKASFQNRSHGLWPGQFVRVVLRLGTKQNALIIPGQAVQTAQEGSFVFVVKPDQTVESRPVIPGMHVNEQIVIEKGLQLGETVVTEGQLRLAVGSHVRIR